MKRNIAVVLSIISIILAVASIVLSVKNTQDLKKMTSSIIIAEDKIVDETPQVEEKKEIKEEIPETENVDENEVVQEEQESKEQQEESAQETDAEEEQEEVVEEPAFYLSDEERQARLSQQAKIQEAREFLYTQNHSLENAHKINMYDKMMIENNTVDFSKLAISIMGDSVSAGVGSTPNSNGEYKSYAGYIDDYFRFDRFYNYSVGGWCYSDVAGDEMSISMNLDTKINVTSDVFVFFAGINDYIANVDNKRFGTYSPYESSTAGFCGSFDKVCTYMSNYLFDKEIFVVLCYPINADCGGSYTNNAEPHSWRDYIEAQRVIATRHGFHIIDLYSTGLIDGHVPEIARAYMSDSVHPNDEGYRVLGDHIAAEISYVLGK